MFCTICQLKLLKLPWCQSLIHYLVACSTFNNLAQIRQVWDWTKVLKSDARACFFKKWPYNCWLQCTWKLPSLQWGVDNPGDWWYKNIQVLFKKVCWNWIQLTTFSGRFIHQLSHIHFSQDCKAFKMTIGLIGWFYILGYFWTWLQFQMYFLNQIIFSIAEIYF